MRRFHLFRKITAASAALALLAAPVFPSSYAAADISSERLTSALNRTGSTTADASVPAHSAAFISPKLNTTISKEVRVIVQLSNQPVAVGKYAARMGITSFAAESTATAIQSEQSTFMSRAAAQGIPLKINYQFNTVLNGVEVTVPANKIPELAKLPGVKSVYENAVYYSIPVIGELNNGSDQPNFDIAPLKQIGVDAAWSKGLTGKGIKVGVIDTGVDYEHPDLKGAFKNGDYGYDSFYKDNDPYEEPPVPEEGFAGTYHGTHVSGTIAGRGTNPSSGIVQKGVAYESELHVYKVLGRNDVTGRSSGSSAQVIDGIERAVKDGMQVINLSLGSDSVKDPNSPDSIAINNAVLSGVVAVVANGNAADEAPPQYYYTMGAPASSQLAISVGAVTSPSNHYTAQVSDVSYVESPASSVTADTYADSTSVATATYEPEAPPTATQATYDLNVMGWETGKENFASVLGTNPLDSVYVNLGQEEDYAGKDVEGKVVLVSRGTLAFVDKLAIAKEHGAVAAVIFNGNASASNPSQADLSSSVSGRDGFIGSTAYLGDSFDFIPAFDMKGSEGRALAKRLLNNSDIHFRLAFSSDYPLTQDPGDQMASFSSRGPNSDGSLGIKPDVSAPGVNILSTWPAYGKQNPGISYDTAYNRISGTSMATPHVAGLAVLLKQQHPDWTPMDIRAALANTSDTIHDATGTLYDVYSQGAGRVDIANAIETPALLEAVDPITILDKDLNPQDITNYSSSISFGVLKAGSTAKKQLQLSNKSGQSVQYKAHIDLHNQVTSNPYDPVATPDVRNINVQLNGLNADSTITAGPNEQTPFYLAVSPKSGAAKGVYEGEVVLESAGYPTLHLPFVVHVGNELPDNGLGVQDVELTHNLISTDPKSDQKTTNVSFRLTAEDVNVIDLLVLNLDDEVVGVMDSISKKDLSLLKPGEYTFKKVDTSYIDGEKDRKGKDIVKSLPEGQYQLMIQAQYVDKATGESSGEGYIAFASLRVADLESELVDKAAAAFDPKITNTSVIGRQVLTLPKTDGVKYEVTKSSERSYVDSKGILKKIPKTKAVNVTLTVKITSKANPSKYELVPVTFTIGTRSK
ncbi:S8 family serine peptidase [Paenibacillus sp. JX-17]|uniref:S8 family serine peptidase n=1 Tax=Paenibacillus lacisoli TaxID=3064525 RepID=A0ABT9CFZ9_9BACL|nr:S8 family serine peptidase [Paenibacillus sp. JX-17]MDO7908204.1 S8 family serine peptidase [Paenibacillus sp. JX-17]